VAYRADIEIAVRGAQELKRLQNEVSATSKLVNQLNNYLENIGSGGIVRSINNLRDVVGRAAAAFNEAALGTDEATIAAKKYIAATNELNTGLRERVELLKQITEQERKAKLAAAGVRETTQYGGPIGPGQASPVALSSQLRGRTEQILAERKGAKELEQVLGALEERRRLEANAMLDQKAASVALQAERKKEKFLAGSTQFVEPIGPGQASPVALASQLRGRTEQILAERKGRTELNAVLQAQFEAEQRLVNSKLDAKAAKVQQVLDQQAAAAAESAAQTKKLADRQLEFTERTEAAARAAKAQTAEFVRQQRITKQMRGVSAQAPAGGFPVEGPMSSPGFRGMQKSVGRFGENLALGAGFPLLFGGGAGSVLGSVLGSFVGTGFGGQILGGALGQALDQALVKIKDIGNAIKTLDFKTLTESGIRLSAEIQGQLELLTQVGDKLTAQKILSQEIANETGTLPGVTEDVANSVNILSDSWRKVVNAVSTTVGIIGAPFAVALAAILEAINAIFRVVNGVFSLLGKGIKVIGKFVVELVAGKEALDAINSGLDSMNSGLAEANAQAAQFRSILNQSVVQSAIELQVTRQLTPGVTPEDKITNQRLQAQKELDILFQEEIEARVKIRQENAKASAEIVEGLIKQNDLLYKNKAETIKINSNRQITAEIQRNQAEQERKAAQELEKQRRELERIAKLRLEQLDNAQRAFVLAEAELDVLSYEDPIRKVQAEYDKIRAERMFKYSDLLKKALSDEERAFIVKTQYTEILRDQLREEEAVLEAQKKQTAELYAQLKASGILNEQAQRDITKGATAGGIGTQNGKLPAGGFTPGLPQLAGERGDRGKIEDRIAQIKEEVKELTNIGNIAIKVADGIGEAFSTAFQGLVSGAMTAKEALASFFQSVGDMFIKMAAEIIAKQTVMITLQLILKALGAIAASAGPATGAAASKGYTLPKGGGYAGGFSMPPIMGRAAGGSATGGTPYLVGERGPELFVPGTSGNVMSNNDLRSAMGSSSAAAGAPVLNMSFQTTNIGGVEYVSRDQLEQAMAATRRQAASDGAKRGMTMTLDKLQQSPGTRSRVGLR
jgi:hypothetical protein